MEKSSLPVFCWNSVSNGKNGAKKSNFEKLAKKLMPSMYYRRQRGFFFLSFGEAVSSSKIASRKKKNNERDGNDVSRKPNIFGLLENKNKKKKKTKRRTCEFIILSISFCCFELIFRLWRISIMEGELGK